ncbi:hypothetical protein [Pseudoponticoccus marisrubri]|uniref:Uncharacterized protein n=1 Tax=Pseudoponticoccus marisrubri TaxID=1685382 RepID=A0A0W7WL12_9RHOB|nr:hypothetical protein [Pseudoponticoccus marisrubri]KUF11204.1 hypothetical protein AVJ23_09140 [Pseudoponticoccus marisrubri]
MAEVFSFRPASLRGAVDWRLEGDRLLTPEGWRDLSTLQGARLVQSTVRGILLRRLDLSFPEGRTRIAINVPRSAGPEQPDRRAHLALCRAIAAQLAKHQPQLPVHLGEGGRVRWVMFGMGAVSVLIALAIFFGALASGVSTDRLIGAAIPVGLLVLFGGAVMATTVPWAARPACTATELPARLARWDDA